MNWYALNFRLVIGRDTWNLHDQSGVYPCMQPLRQRQIQNPSPRVERDAPVVRMSRRKRKIANMDDFHAYKKQTFTNFFQC